VFVCPVRGRSRRAVNEGRKVAVRSLLMAKFHGHTRVAGGMAYVRKGVERAYHDHLVCSSP